MIPAHIVVIGAGSASFGLNTLAALMRSPRLRGSRLALVDRDPEALALVGRLAQRLNGEWDAQMTVTTHTHHAEALEGAQFVVLSIEVPPRERLWRMDYEIPLKYGVRQPYAENGGPGGFAHAARNIVPVMEIVRDMERACPDAWLINYTNPMIRICDAIARYSRIKVVGLCHQIYVGYATVGLALAKDLGFTVPEGFTDTRASLSSIPAREVVIRQAVERLDIKAAGLNHLAVNVPNRGAISNLPEGAIVEVPGLVSGAGVQGVCVGALPEPIAELCRREITVARLCVDAAVNGDRRAALQCLLLDPVITDFEVAQKVLDDYLTTYREYLPQFWKT